MATLVFHGGTGIAEIALDEAVEIRISGGALSAGGPTLAQHTGGAWHVGSQRIDRIVCTGHVRVEFEGDAGRRSLGPFPEFLLTGDVAVTPNGVLARYQALDQMWYFSRDDARSDDLVLRLFPEYAPA